MHIEPTTLLCDGCGLPASVQHIADRVARLERATRFRPIHINILFLALAPPSDPKKDFYGPNEAGDPLLAALDIGQAGGAPSSDSNTASVIEFQKKGYFQTYLSECPPTPQAHKNSGPEDSADPEYFSRLSISLIRRIRFNYRPKHVALLGANMHPMIKILEQAKLGPLLLLDQGQPLTLPQAGDPSSLERFRKTLQTQPPHEAAQPGM
jgi:hypothetical protein